ncbi:M56 family metallopeptidase [Paenactinomyces guangxiensis]|uniref:M56 family metallopeptidase n=1 Tax=Paenactinomyces guangxiensis TaxID=1490290 RepID=A0A7W1WSS2_9BACL|nr:M56 family metallopeptidase [Paenactinomyces guangxiensis]MBA4495299.1 M56 family metallopeptidase [Paenactinomyces guangxiensis]MBH8592579.1 M56 family metallopeptidase [Paenactinomyces guangxiensis]
MKSFRQLFALALFIGITLHVSWIISTNAVAGPLLDWLHRCCSFIFSNGRIPVEYYLLASIHLLFLLLFICRMLMLAWKTHRQVARLLQNQSGCIPAEIQHFSRKRGTPVIVVDHEQPLAFTYGWLHPKILISSSLIRQLHESELQAVLEHEYYHCLQRDPLKMLFASSATLALFFLPLVHKLRGHYLIEKEIAADRHSIRTAGVKPLASALLKLMNARLADSPSHGTAGFANDEMEARIEAMIHDRAIPPRIYLKDYLLSLAGLAVILLPAFYLLTAITHTHHMVRMAIVPISLLCNLLGS